MDRRPGLAEFRSHPFLSRSYLWKNNGKSVHRVISFRHVELYTICHHGMQQPWAPRVPTGCYSTRSRSLSFDTQKHRTSTAPLLFQHLSNPSAVQCARRKCTDCRWCSPGSYAPIVVASEKCAQLGSHDVHFPHGHPVWRTNAKCQEDYTYPLSNAAWVGGKPAYSPTWY